MIQISTYVENNWSLIIGNKFQLIHHFALVGSPAMSTHDLHNEGTLMRVSCTDDSIDTLDNAM